MRITAAILAAYLTLATPTTPARSGDSGYTPRCGALPCLTVGQNEPLGQAGTGISMYISYPTGGTGQLTIDPDHVEVFISYLAQAKAQLAEIYRQGRRLEYVDPPGEDPFSPTAVDDIQRTAGDQPGGHLYANQRAQRAYEAIIENLTASLATYRESEARGTERFQGGG